MKLTCTARFSPLLVALAILPGCLLIRRGREQEIFFGSSPQGATVSVDGKTGKTPCRIMVSRGSASRGVRFTGAAGVVSGRIDSRDSAGDAGDFFALVFDSILIIPVIIDAGTGAFWIRPEVVHADFEAGTVEYEF